MAVKIGVVGDIGGTNARFGVVFIDEYNKPTLQYPTALPAKDFNTAEDALDAYLSQNNIQHPLDFSVMAVAGPVTNGSVSFTNLNWTLSEERIKKQFGIKHVSLINDFTAMAKSISALSSEDFVLIGPAATGTKGAPIAVLGPGTGFGVSALLRNSETEVLLSTEAGHIPFAPQSELEIEIWRILQQAFGRVSVERILSGPGLISLYQALSQINGHSAHYNHSSEITQAADSGDTTAEQAVDYFCNLLGAVAGDVVLALGARGGVYIAGGIAPRMLNRLAKGSFRKNFAAKGRLSSYVEQVPTRVIVQRYAALFGAMEMATSLLSDNSHTTLSVSHSRVGSELLLQK
ncbi:glucokinase [Klebsiella oxytoca]|uniref:glucokinase n=1 Tax=Klebsiella oxytoca TaxID=571 RepID=UPI003570F7A8